MADGSILFAGADLDESVWRVAFESAIRSGHDAAVCATKIVRS
jgi:hypothetical protein